ncbi:MAG: hypothetical protein DRH30_14580 [Deltaproteobacteria bacterium]|nr:MAG: hypothetical protein DRH30_14580 [Deltaproteobacteria bacterium]
MKILAALPKRKPIEAESQDAHALRVRLEKRIVFASLFLETSQDPANPPWHSACISFDRLGGARRRAP